MVLMLARESSRLIPYSSSSSHPLSRLARTAWQIACDAGIIVNGNRAGCPAGLHRRKQFWIPNNLVHELDERFAYILPCLRAGLAEFCPMLGGQRLALFPADDPRCVRLVELGPNLYRDQFYVPQRVFQSGCKRLPTKYRATLETVFISASSNHFSRDKKLALLEMS